MKQKNSILFLIPVLCMLIPGILFAGPGAEKSAGKQKLVMIFSAGGSGNALKAAAERFSRESGIEVEVLLFPVNETYEKEVLALNSRQGTPDIIAMDDTWFASMWRYLDPLTFDKNFLDGFVPSMLESFNYEGKQYAIPVRMGGEVIIYREDVMKEAGIDPLTLTSWEKIYEAGLKLKNPRQNIYSWVGGYNSPSYLVSRWQNIICSYGVRVFSPDMKKFAFNTPEGVRATEMFVKILKDLASPGILSYGFAEEVEALQTGTAVMGQLWTARWASVDSPKFPFSGKFKVLPFYPYGENSGLSNGVTMVTGWGLGVNRFSKNKEAAIAFLKYIGSFDEQLRLAVENSNSPVVSKVFDHPDYIKAVPVAKDMQAAVRNGGERPMHVRWNEIEAAIGLNLEKAVVGMMTVPEALQAAERDALKILNE